jgi:hypothetical protein
MVGVFREKRSGLLLLLLSLQQKHQKRSGFDIFTVHGFDGWKRVNGGKKCAFLAHVWSGPCSQHNNAVRDCQAILNQSNHIATIIEVQSNKDKEKD